MAEKSRISSKEAKALADFESFLRNVYYKDLLKAANEKRALAIDFKEMDEFEADLGNMLLKNPDKFFELAEKSMEHIELPGSVGVRFFNLPEAVTIRDLRSRHINRFIGVEGVVRKASEIRPEIIKTIWECPECGNVFEQERKANFIPNPTWCECGNRKGFKQIDKKLFDTRWVVVEEPFELTEGDRPSQVTILLKDDLVSTEGRRLTDPGNRLKITGVLRDIPKGKSWSIKLDFYLEANHVEPTEVGWEKMEITEEDEKKIKKLAADTKIYEKLTKSLAPSIYGLSEVKESVILQLFGGIPRTVKDGTRIRGNIHLLLIGDPACLVADERVVMADGTIMKIGEMGSEHLQDIYHRVHLGMGRKVGRAVKFHTYKQEPIMEIITETGKSIKGTYNQPILTVENMQQSWKRLDEIKVGERVRVLPGIECRKKTFVKPNWKDYPHYHKTWRIKVPKFVDEDLAALFGYIIADGWVQNRRVAFIINKEESDIVPKIKNIFKKCFKAPVHEHEHKRASPRVTYYQVDRTHIARLVSFLNEKRVPDLIFQSGNSVVASFLRWLYEGDGSVFCGGRGRTSVSLKSNNIELLRDVQTLLLRFGIQARILWEKKPRPGGIIEGRQIQGKQSGSLMIRRSESIIKFWENIGFVSKKKRTKLEETVEYARSHTRHIHKKRTEKIVEVNKLPPQDVFDIEVPKHQRFVANGIVVHNTAKSQILKLVPKMVPRARYVSGKGVTAAGLTASVTKDEQFMGGWVLEAGAMVLANKGLLSIDEFEKMSQDDQVAMHEALEQNSISIAKASIVATLPADTSVLAGGNPKFSRFDPMISIAKQITIPDTLLSRFDLKFALRDIPHEESDKKVTEHILKSREDDYDAVKPVVDPNFIKKYISYTKENCKPELSKEAGRMIRNFYTRTRKKAEGGSGPVPITLRQFEAMIRLSEASAKIQLSPVVRKEDAQRAIRLMKFSLQQLGLDPESGLIDVDKAEGGTTSSERSHIRVVLDIIAEFSTKKKEISIKEIEDKAREEGVENASDIVDKLKREGMLFEPNPGYVQKV